MMRVSAKADYAIRAMVELAAAGGGPVKAERISQAQEIPIKFLENIMSDLRNAGLVRSQRGIDGGYWLARPAERDRPRPGDPRRRRPARERPRPPAGGGRLRAARRSRSATCGSPCARACAACSSRSRSPTSRSGELPDVVGVASTSRPTTPGSRTSRSDERRRRRRPDEDDLAVRRARAARPRRG